MLCNKEELNYLHLLEEVLENGIYKKSRTGIDTISLFSKQLKFNLQTGFPILTSKKVFFKTSLAEMLWFISGSTNVNDLPKFAQKIWRSWADSDGSIGKTYGYQFRNNIKWLHDLDEEQYEKININLDYQEAISSYNFNNLFDVKINTDQIKRIEYLLKNNKDDRRMVIDLWNPSDLDEMNLPPCLFSYVFSVLENHLNCHITMRSADLPIGVPYNITGASLLIHMFANIFGLQAGELSINMVDCHIYVNQIDAVKEQLKNNLFKKPQLLIKRSVNSILDYNLNDFELIDYVSNAFIPMNVAV